MGLIVRFKAGNRVASVTLSPATFTIAPLATQQLTATVRDAADNVLTGRTVAWTSTNEAVATVDSNGLVTGVAAGMATITGSCEGVDGTSAATVSAEVTPDFVEDFSTYTSTANLLADPRGIYDTAEDRIDQGGAIVLDTSVGYGASDRSMRYDYPAGTATDYYISRSLNLAPPGLELWIEVVVRMKDNFSIQNPNVASSDAMKFLHVGVLPDGHGRWGLGFNNGNAGTFESEAAFGSFSSGDFDTWHLESNAFNIAALRDEQPHIIRYHVRLDGSNDLHEYWADGVLQGSVSGPINSVVTDYVRLSLMRNINRQPPEATSLWWHRIRVWYSNPGWEG